MLSAQLITILKRKESVIAEIHLSFFTFFNFFKKHYKNLYTFVHLGFRGDGEQVQKRSRWQDSYELRKGRGVSDWSDELFVGTEKGMHKVPTVRRREVTERVDLMFLNSVSARPWDGPKKVRDVRVVLPDVSSPAAMAEAEAIGRTRRLHINKADIMKYGLTEGCLGCRCLAEVKRAQGHSEGCRAQLEAEIAKTEEGRTRLTTAYVRSLPRDEGRELGAGAEAPTAVPAPPRSDEVQDEPMNAQEASRKRGAEDAGHEADDAGRGGAQPDPGSMVDDSMSSGGRPTMLWHWRRYSPASRQRAGAFGLSAGVATDLRLGWDLGLRTDQVKAEKRLSDEKPHLLIFSPMCLVLSRVQHTKPGELAELREQGKRHLEFCMQSGKIANRARWTRSL